ncbi:MAG: YceI family protein [Flavobacteriaceae bacterium]|nr:YceI family protein [Flavobacteriaceae bacterium]
MKKLLSLILVLASTSLVAQDLIIKESEAQVSFVFLDEDVGGTIEGFSFTGDIDSAVIGNSEISGSVATKTLDTNNWLRSRHLRSKKFFHAKEYPTLTFTSSQINGTRESFEVTGTLTIKGISNNVVWKFEDNGNKLKGSTTINTHDYNIKVYDEKERCEVAIAISLPYTLQ